MIIVLTTLVKSDNSTIYLRSPYLGESLILYIDRYVFGFVHKYICINNLHPHQYKQS